MCFRSDFVSFAAVDSQRSSHYVNSVKMYSKQSSLNPSFHQKMLTDESNGGFHFTQSPRRKIPSTSTQEVSGRDWTDSFSSSSDLNTSLFSGTKYDPNFAPFIPATQNGGEFYRSTSFDAAADLMFPSFDTHATHRLRNFDPHPSIQCISQMRRFPTEHIRRRIAAADPRSTENGLPAKLYGNNNQSSLDRALFPATEEGQYLNPEGQIMDWMTTPPMQNYPSESVYKTSSIPHSFRVFPGRPVEKMDESGGDFLLSLGGKRKPVRKRENLPRESTAILKKWLLEHLLMPYPNNDEKLELCCATALEITQINNWFINARVRIWKPIVIRTFKKFKIQLIQHAEASGDENLKKRILEAEKSTTMSMISLLVTCPEARKELEEAASAFV